MVIDPAEPDRVLCIPHLGLISEKARILPEDERVIQLEVSPSLDIAIP